MSRQPYPHEHEGGKRLYEAWRDQMNDALARRAALHREPRWKDLKPWVAKVWGDMADALDKAKQPQQSVALDSLWWQTRIQGILFQFDIDPYIHRGTAKCYADGVEAKINSVSRYRDGGTTPMIIELQDGRVFKVTRPSPLREARAERWGR